MVSSRNVQRTNQSLVTSAATELLNEQNLAFSPTAWRNPRTNRRVPRCMLGDIKNKFGEKTDFTFPTGKKESDTIVVLGHGVTGNKDRPFLVTLAEELAKGGLNTLRFSFSGNGGSAGRFIDSNISKEVEDLGAVLDNLANARI